MTRTELIDELLGFMERAEAKLLSWGFYDLSFSPLELEERIAQEASAELKEALAELEADGEILQDLLEEMSYAPLALFKTADQPARYRTRFAESIRLFARLRQFFSTDEWHTGARLVADLRVHIGARRYPRRDLDPAACWPDLEPHAQDAGLASELFRDLTGGFTLAGFQQRAFTRIFREYGAKRRSGTVISAGTGSGKTKGFYVPALLRVAEDVSEDPTPFVKVIAIYPRNVLLADQLREAVAEVQKMNPLLAKRGIRSLSVGALLGQTPKVYWFNPDRTTGGRTLLFEGFDNPGWRRAREGSVIPYLASGQMASPQLTWLDADREAGSTRLVDEVGVEHVADGVLRITREQLQAKPPDILFLSLEMLSKEIGNSDWWHGLGANQPVRRRPRLLLLDEVHSYEGTPGAMASWALRRWLHRVKPRGLHVVGLSATLKDAAQHLATMSGVHEASIDEVRPRADELEAEGAEYSLALKGDPGSGAALLSTTIQAGMLLARLLKPLSQPVAAADIPEFFGRKVFGFTDNLDSLNRWLPNMTDAESNLHLAALRRTDLDDRGGARDRDGQLWCLPEAIGHDLQQALRVGRCSSQDPGVDPNANLTVASSALEVGFDDPEVGGTIHHKKPTSMSSFIQRKGRAGRRRGMRPWTVMVLSDYATDRWAFQNIERFFEPEIDSLRVPIENPYVLKAQGAMFLLDWLGIQLRAGGPHEILAKAKDANRRSQSKAVRLLRELLEQGPAWVQFRNEFETFLQNNRVGATSSDAGQLADLIFWEAPRPVLRHAVPDLLQTLESWTTEGLTPSPDLKRPLPAYVPAASFAPLSEGEISLEFQQENKRDEVSAYAKGLRDFCPGNVSKRYATRQNERGDWLRLSRDLIEGREEISVEELFPQRLHLGEHNGIATFAPLQLELEECPRNVSDRCTSSWEWSSHLQAEGTPWLVPVFERDRWSGAIQTMTAFMAREGGAVDVFRIASSFRYEVGAAGQEKEVRRAELRSADTAQRQGVAERRSADGLRVETTHLPIDLDALQALGLLPLLRTEYFRDLAREALLNRNLNIFLADRIIETSLAMLVVRANTERCDLSQAQRLVADDRPAAATVVLNVVLGAGLAEEDDDSELGVAERVARVWADPEICEELENLEKMLWSAPDDKFAGWLQQRNAETVAQGLKTAVLALTPGCAENDFDLDIEMTAEGANIYLTETTAGGVGNVERVVGAIASEPDRFEQAFSRSLKMCPVDATFRTLRTVSSAAARNSDVWLPALNQARQAVSFSEADDARRGLRKLLKRSRLDATRSTVATVMNRVARPGTNHLSDRLMHLVNEFWTRLEARIGIAIDPQVLRYVLLERGPVFRRLVATLRGLGGGANTEPSQVRSFLDQFLIPRCHEACRDCLDHPSWYERRVRPSRALAVATGLVPPQFEVEDTAAPAWKEEVRAALQDRGDARLKWGTENENSHELSVELFGLLGETADAGTVLLPIAVTALEADPDGWVLSLSARSPAR